jgi:Glyoxalase-like domain
MASYIKSVSFDCVDALVAARFWAAALNSDVEEDSTSAKAFVEAPGWGGPNIWFNQVPEPKLAKTRMHFDLRAPGTVEAEVSRLQALGATVMEHHPSHVVMCDPDGHEFCVEPGNTPS